MASKYGKLALAGLASVGLGLTLYRGISRKMAREHLQKLLTTKSAAATKTRYPITPKNPVTEVFHGTTKVTDNYRWLEDPDSDVTKTWVSAQNEVTNKYLDELKADRTAVGVRLKELFNYERYGVPFRRGTRIFYFKNDGLQNQSVLYWYDEKDQKSNTAFTGEAGAAAAAAAATAAGSAAAAATTAKSPIAREPPRTNVKVLLDPNTLAADGTSALGTYSITDSGEFLAYGVARSGSDWNTIHVRRISDGFEYSDKLEWVKFSSIAWTTDDKGFFYSRYPSPKQFAAGDTNFARGTETDAVLNQTLYYHRLGTDQSADKLIWSNTNDPKWMIAGSVTDDGQYLLLYINDSCDPVNRLYYARMQDLKLDDAKFDAASVVVKLIDNFDAEYSAIANVGSVFYIKTNLKAPRGKVVRIDFANPSVVTEVLPQREEVLDSIQCVDKDKLLAVYLEHVKEVPRLYTLTGAPIPIEFGLPGPGSLGVAGNFHDPEVFYKFTSFLYPGSIYRLNVRTGKLTLWGEITVKGFDPSAFKTEQVFYASKDGTRIPMFITSRRDIELKANNPTLLYGYGGFNISLPPAFSASVLLWLQHYRGVYAVPNIRGGGEYGIDWHKGGCLLNKQNVFDDFCGAAEWLIAQKYTRSDRLAINGASNGGLLVAACINQRPELFGAAVAQVGVLDMLRFHKWTIGYAWCSDYGNADTDSKQFDALYKYSPVHNVVKKPYPATLVMTADHDDRVVPAHSFKYIAALQDAVGEEPFQKRPVLIRIETKAGHGAGKPLAKQIEELSDYYAFVANNLGATWNA